MVSGFGRTRGGVGEEGTTGRQEKAEKGARGLSQEWGRLRQEESVNGFLVLSLSLVALSVTSLLCVFCERVVAKPLSLLFVATDDEGPSSW